MSDLHVAFVSKSFLRSHWDLEYRAWRDSDNEKALNDRLALWAKRTDLKETSAESAFIDVFFRETWGYVQTGQRGSETGFSLYPKFAIPGAGANGGSGEADLAIGYFSKTAPGQIPQVLCEFKAIRSALDTDQKRKGNTRSPVRQCLEYLGFARRGMIGSEPNLPTWGIVTDMNEFRLYWYDRGHQQSLRFTIQPRDLFQGTGLLAENEEARFDRFLFQKVFHRETLLTPGGKCLLLSLIGQQRFRDRKLENAFYAEYRNFRERLYGTLLEKNPEGTPRFPGAKGRLVRLAQKILDRCIFIFFCEDMRQALAFPPQLLRNFLIERSNDPYYDAEATTIWQDLLRLFHAMNEGKAFGGKALNQFNGGLFAPDADLEKLHVHNSIFCQHMQGQNEASLYTFKETVLYLCASYNFVGGWAQGLSRPPVADGSTGERDHLKSVGLYTLGRIFEQSITELEIREAEVDGRPSVNKESKRKRDGVYYTPEWVVERIVDETLRPRLHEIKRECGWPSNKLPKKEALDAFIARLKTLTVVDPACGSGAFLITTLRYLLDTWHAVREQRKSVTGEIMTEDDAGLVRDILKSNVYGEDTNSASAEIARLALWLHTARGDKPLSSLDTTIREGNSLISSDFFKGQINLAFYGEVEKERINAFDLEKAFPEVFERGGFDAVVGNPPYVKLQNFRKVHDDMAEFLRSGRQDIPGYTSTQSGNFDLYLPFIEKGLSILNEHGRLGFIAPSLWTVNEYGAALRAMIADGQNLDRWLDFKAHQIFEESTVYTALQFYTKQPNDAVKVAFAPNGVVAGDPWSGMECRVAYDNLDYGDRWLLLAGRERALIDRLSATCRRLDDPTVTTNIYQGLITSADAIYHLDRRGPRRYLCSPRGKGAPLAYEVEIEDEVMQPLVSGADSRRYIEPRPTTYILFPYVRVTETMHLIDTGTFQQTHPRAWKYLCSYDAELRAREATRDREGNIVEAPFDDNRWYRFGRHQNIDKQDIPKLIVPRLVAKLICFVDARGDYCLDNVDVGGVEPAVGVDLFFIAGLMNSEVLNFVFQRISKPFRGNYLSANKQFIAPLPIPNASPEQAADVARRARNLQESHTARRDKLVSLAKRMETIRRRAKPETWLFPNLKSKRELEADAPSTLDTDGRQAWAAKHYGDALEALHEAIGQRLNPGAALGAAFANGELSFSIDGVTVIDRIFESEAEGTFILAQWKVLATTFQITERTVGKKLCDALRKLARTTAPP
jgi:hypothetical protein